MDAVRMLYRHSLGAPPCWDPRLPGYESGDVKDVCALLTQTLRGSRLIRWAEVCIRQVHMDPRTHATAIPHVGRGDPIGNNQCHICYLLLSDISAWFFCIMQLPPRNITPRLACNRRVLSGSRYGACASPDIICAKAKQHTQADSEAPH